MKPHEKIEKVNEWLIAAGIRTDNISFAKCLEIFDRIGEEIKPDKTMVINAMES